MIRLAETGPPAGMSGRFLWQKIELVNVALGAWVRTGLGAGLVRDQRRDKIGLVIAERCPPPIPAEWADPIALAYLEIQAALIDEIAAARTALLPLVMELFEIEELVILDLLNAETQADKRISEPFIERLREMGFRSPRAILGRAFGGAVSLRYSRLLYKAGLEPDAAMATDSLPGLRAREADVSAKRKSTRA